MIQMREESEFFVRGTRGGMKNPPYEILDPKENSGGIISQKMEIYGSISSPSEMRDLRFFGWGSDE